MAFVDVEQITLLSPLARYGAGTMHANCLLFMCFVGNSIILPGVESIEATMIIQFKQDEIQVGKTTDERILQ